MDLILQHTFKRESKRKVVHLHDQNKVKHISTAVPIATDNHNKSFRQIEFCFVSFQI